MASKRMQLLESDIFSHLTSLKYVPRWIVLLCDVLVCCVSFLLAYLLARQTYATQIVFHSAWPVWSQALLLIAVTVLSFWVFHTYSGILRYSSFVDIVKLLAAVLLQEFLLVVVNEICKATTEQYIFLRMAVLFYGIISILLLVLLRLVVKVSFDYLVTNGSVVKPVAVYGIKSVGVGIAKMIRSSDSLKFRLAAFLDDDKGTESKKIFSVPVISTHNRAAMLRALAKRKIRTVIVSPLKMTELDPEKDLDVFIENNIEILIVPDVNEWHEGSNFGTWDSGQMGKTGCGKQTHSHK